jgi:hypothetical protein
VCCAPALAAPVCPPGQLEARLAAIHAGERPDPQGVPTDVDLGLMLIDLFSIDVVQQRFTADLRVELSWRDHRLAPETLGCDASGARVPLDAIWHPEIFVLNGFEVETSLNRGVGISAGGGARITRRYTGSFSTPMKLEDFPLETQHLEVVLGTLRMGPDQVEVHIDSDRSGIFAATTVAGWSVEAPSFEVGAAQLADLTINRVRYAFPARRRPGFFAYKVVLPLALIVAMSWSVFWLDPKHVEAQLGVASASVLTVIAFQLSFGDLLPQIPYLTRLDRFVLGSTVLVFAALGEAITTSSLSARERLVPARRIDQISRYAFPAVYGAFILFCFL